MYTISFVTANLVARETGYNMRFGWKQGDSETNNYFQAIESFDQRFSALIGEITKEGFRNIDLWSAHLNPQWFTEKHLEIANRILRANHVKIVSLAGNFGDVISEFERVCTMAETLSVPLLGGIGPVMFKSTPEVVRLLKKHKLRLAIENHPEKTPTEMLEKIGDTRDGLIGTTVDTGWYATHGYDVPKAITELGNHVYHIHFKDIYARGAHETCKFGDGIVPIDKCIEALISINYQGAISIEHEPANHNPLADCHFNMNRLIELMQKHKATL